MAVRGRLLKKLSAAASTQNHQNTTLGDFKHANEKMCHNTAITTVWSNYTNMQKWGGIQEIRTVGLHTCTLFLQDVNLMGSNSWT